MKRGWAATQAFEPTVYRHCGVYVDMARPTCMSLTTHARLAAAVHRGIYDATGPSSGRVASNNRPVLWPTLNPDMNYMVHRVGLNTTLAMDLVRETSGNERSMWGIGFWV